MRDLFKRLLGGKAEKTGDSRQAFAELNREAPLLPAEPRSSANSDAEGFVCRETLLGRDQRVAGYHFLLQQATRTRLASRSRRIHHIYSEVLVRNLIRMDIGRLLGHRLAFIDLPDSFLGHESLLMLPPANTVLTVATLPDEGAPTPSAVLEQVRALRARGYRFAVNAMANEAPGAYLLPEAEFVVVRVDSAEPKRIRDFADALKRTTPPRTWLARGLPGHDEFQLCFNLGAGLFQGPFITRREDWTGNSLGPNAARIADLLSRLRRDEELSDIAASLKQDPALSLRLLRYINSAAMGLREEVTSIERALMQLGRDRLYRWLSLLLYGADSRNPNASALLETALVRARMLELLGEARPKAERESLFLVGLFSLVDAVLQVPMATALEQLAAAPAIVDAVLHRQGPMARLLQLAIASESGDEMLLACAAEAADIELEPASAAHIEALAWAMQVMAE